jgi:hypothetical protein
VVHMRVPHERDERAHVEKRPAHHSSSSARRTTSGVIGGVRIKLVGNKHD